MKILHVISSMDPSTGGPPAVAAGIAIAQQKLGHDVYILTNDTPEAEEVIRPLLESLPGGNDIKLIYLASKFMWQSLSVKRIESKLAEKGFRPDVLHLHGLWEFTVVGASRYARSQNIPYVIRPFGMLNFWSLGQKRLKKKLALIWYYKRMLRSTAFLHMLNKDEADACALLDHIDFEVIPNGIFLEQINNEIPEGTFHRKFPELENKPYLLYLSRLHHVKGIDYLIDAFVKVNEKFPDLRLVVAGPDSGNYRMEIQSRIEKLQLGHRIHLVGPLYSDDKKAALVDAEIFCLTSRSEGFSMAITEAMAYSCPVVISNECHFPEVAQFNAGKVIPLDAQSIAEGIIEYLENPEVAKAAGVAGRRLIEDSFTWNQIALKAIAAYKKYL